MEPVSSDQLAAWAGEARERWNAPGIAVGLLRDRTTVTAADGVRDLERAETVSPTDVFRIASITKPFVATLAMTLVQDGLLDLDEPPPGTGTSATVRQLLSHQGGLSCEWPSPLDVVGDDDGALLRLAAGEPGRLPLAPGELFSYSNAGFWLVGAAVARACETTFEEAMRVRVLEPLGLETTGFDVERPVPGHNQVFPGADEHRRAEGSYPRARRPSGGLWSSVGDLLRFAAHHLGGSGPLEAASVEELQRPVVSGPGFQHGLGWFLQERGGRRSVEHAGSVAGYQSLLLVVPDEGLAFAALTNSSRGAVAIRDVLDSLRLSLPVVDDFPLDAEKLAAFAGRYKAPGVRIEIAPEGRHLRLEYSEGDPLSREWHRYPAVRLRPVGAREFELAEGEWKGQRLGFPRDELVSFRVVAHRAR
jgi:CubicO group peptidase (beta-lactamase class C family)